MFQRGKNGVSLNPLTNLSGIGLLKKQHYEHSEIYSITKCGKKEMEDVSKLHVMMTKDFKNLTTMVKVMTMNVNKCNVT